MTAHAALLFACGSSVRAAAADPSLARGASAAMRSAGDTAKATAPGCEGCDQPPRSGTPPGSADGKRSGDPVLEVNIEAAPWSEQQLSSAVYRGWPLTLEVRISHPSLTVPTMDPPEDLRLTGSTDLAQGLGVVLISAGQPLHVSPERHGSLGRELVLTGATEQKVYFTVSASDSAALPLGELRAVAALEGARVGDATEPRTFSAESMGSCRVEEPPGARSEALHLAHAFAQMTYHLARDEHPLADAALDRALVESPSHALLLAAKGEVAVRRGDRTAAIAHYEAAIDAYQKRNKDPHAQAPLLLLARLKQLRGE